MSNDKKWNVLFIKDEKSMFDSDTNAFEQCFQTIDKTQGREESLRLFEKNVYDIVICDLSVQPEEIAFMKQLKDNKPEQCIFVLVDEKDTDKVYGFADMGIHAFILTPEQFDQALEAISQFDPYEEQ